MNTKLEHDSIIDKKNQLVCSSRNEDIRFLFDQVTFGLLCTLRAYVDENSNMDFDDNRST